MEQAYYANSSATAETFQRYCLLDTDEPVISIVSKEMRFEALTSEATQRGVRGEPWELGAHANLDWIAPLWRGQLRDPEVLLDGIEWRLKASSVRAASG